MKLPPPNEGGDFTPTPAGTHVAICYRFVDLGTQTSEWSGETKHQHKVMLTWELPDELMDDGGPFAISQRYTWSMHEKANLRHALESWRGKSFSDDDFYGATPFDIKNILGKACLLTVLHEEKAGKTWANIKSIAALPKNMPIPAQVNENVYFSLDRDEFNPGVMEGLSERVQETIKASPEYQALVNAADPAKDGYPDRSDAGGGGTAYDLNDEVPF